MVDPAVPAAPIEALLTALLLQQGTAEGMRAMAQRQAEFPNRLAAQLTDIALDDTARGYADEFLDTYWADEARQQQTLSSADTDREVIIGSGFHAAVYAATRVRSGHPRPLVMERGPRAGGTFAMTARPTFYLNSRNRAGNPGLAGDQQAALNYLPGAPIQAANVGMREYQTNTDMAFVIRLALAQFADVVTSATVRAATRDSIGVQIDLAGRSPLSAGRVIDARGVGDPISQEFADGRSVLTFGQFMARMDGMWPLRGVRRAAVVGGGDSAKCAVESLLGIAPQPYMAAAALDSVERIDWYADDLPDTCDDWQQQIRGRYQAIGRYLRPDRLLTVLSRRARPVALPGAGLIDGRTYNLVVVCTGNQETDIDGLEVGSFYDYRTPDEAVVAREHFELPAFRVGPHARLPFTRQEQADGIADIPQNAVAMFRTATKTAALAATLPALTQD